MLKQWIIRVVVGLAIVAAVTGSSGVAEPLGLTGASPAYACEPPGSSGGGC